MPRLPATVEEDLRGLITAIDKVDRVGDLLEQCLGDLSDSQAKGGQYFTPRDLGTLMVAAAAPQDRHQVLDPVCGSAGLLVEADRYVREQTGLQPSLTLTGRDLHAGTLQIAQLNLTVRGIQADLGTPIDSLAQPSSRTYDIVLANPRSTIRPGVLKSPPLRIRAGRGCLRRPGTGRALPGCCTSRMRSPRRGELCF